MEGLDQPVSQVARYLPVISGDKCRSVLDADDDGRAGVAGGATGEQADAAVSAGASADEIVDVLIGVSTVVGVPRVVAAAPKVALALGYDLDDLED